MDNFLAMERKGRDLFKSLLEDGNITKYKELFDSLEDEGITSITTKIR